MTVKRNPAERAIRTLEEQARLKELFPESVMLERTPRHDSQGHPAERAVRTLEDASQVDFEK